MMRGVAALLALLSVAQPPARDRPRPPARGTAVIAGVITTGARPARPVRRARVALGSPDHYYGRLVITEDDGTFRFEGLPPGRYSLSASKAAYLPTAYGAARSGRPGTTITLGQGDSLMLPMHMDRGGVITGTVLDDEGQPAAGIGVEALVETYAAGTRRRTRAGATTTDDRGEYRMFGLSPGEYFVAARPPRAMAEVQVLTDREIRRALSQVRQQGVQTRPGPSRPSPAPLQPPEPRSRVGFAPVFYPGTPVPARARPITIGHEEERHGIDFQLEHVPVATVRGTVTAPGGTSRLMMVTLSPRRSTDDPAAGLPLSTAGAGGGMFTFTAVPPGEYTVQARVMPAGPAAGRPLDEDAPVWASTDIIVDGQDVTGVSLVLQAPLKISGSVVFKGRPATELPMSIDMPLSFERLDSRTAPAAPRLRVDPDGRFTISGILPGRYVAPTLRGIRSSVGGWWVISVVANGRNLLDHPLELERSVTNAVVTLADRASEITGTLRDRAGHPQPQDHVVVFARDRSSWFYHSPRVVAARTAGNGGYRVLNLPPGEYLIASGTDLHAGEWWDPAVLERLAPGAARITLDEFGKVTVDVTAR
jgi:hypothetical protein